MGQNGRIVVIGGGTGLSTMLRGLKHYTDQITAIVTVADDGGGSGVLRQEMGILPPGDIRNCIVALSNAEPMMRDLLGYRFSEGGLAGQSFGNLFLAALNQVTGSFYQAVRYLSNVLNITGRVLPVTVEDIRLAAEFESGVCVLGESKIYQAKKDQDSRIKRVFLIPEHPIALAESLIAIEEADLLVFGPGSLYTSILPNLLVSGVVEAINRSRAKKIYVCNIMTQPGETDNYSVASHINALISHAKGRKIIDAVLINNSLPNNISEGYAKTGSYPVRLDMENIAPMDITVVSQKLLQENKQGLVRHSSNRVARAVYYWYKKTLKK